MNSLLWFAYIDPGTGSMALQALVAGVFTVAFFFSQLRGYLTHQWQSIFAKKNDK